ncbi:unnamed protein product [Lactuca virosa]|uniref:Factor of DNA methylation 1-5/IDN2 domain-containing protein n=1 Tax=Lactuca virosa TaxID=75947 RepID=A0AAU9M0L3_9ASTR|nr:unnamed protein product [Lactuca virosa]
MLIITPLLIYFFIFLREMEHMESTSAKMTTSLKASILSRYDEVFHAHTSDIKRVNEKITVDCEKFLQYYEDSCSLMDDLTRSLQQREDELKKKQRKLQKEKTKLELKKRVRERLSSCKQLINESCTSRKLAEDLKGELDMLHERRAELESQLKTEDYENLESEIIQLETALQVIHDDDCIDPEEKMMNLKRKLILKDEELRDMKEQENSFRSALQTKNEELQEARLEFIDGLKACSFGGGIGIRRMGLVDSTPFFIGKRKENAAKFSSLCRHLVEDPEWHPFTTITDGSDQKEIINEEDGKMVILKSECSDEQYRAVVTALVERNRYHKNGRDLMEEVWNYRENREITLIEGIDYLLKEWKIQKQRKRRC